MMSISGAYGECGGSSQIGSILLCFLFPFSSLHFPCSQGALILELEGDPWSVPRAVERLFLAPLTARSLFAALV